MCLLAHGAEESGDESKNVRAAAGNKRKALVAGHFFADIRIEARTADIGRPLIIEVDEVDGAFFGGDLRLQVGEITIREAADEIIAAAAGNDAHSCVGAAGQALKHLVHGAVAAAAVKAQVLPAGGGTALLHKTGGIPHAGGQVGFQLLLPPDKKDMQTGQQGFGHIGFSGGGIDNEDVFHGGKLLRC